MGEVFLGLFALAGFFYAEELVSIFRDDPEVIAIGTTALAAQMIALFFQPLSVCANMMFQSTGHKVRALLLALFRGGMCFIPFILVLPRLFGLIGIQLSQPMADVLSAALSLPFSIAFFRSIPKKDVPDMV